MCAIGTDVLMFTVTAFESSKADHVQFTITHQKQAQSCVLMFIIQTCHWLKQKRASADKREMGQLFIYLFIVTIYLNCYWTISPFQTVDSVFVFAKTDFSQQQTKISIMMFTVTEDNRHRHQLAELYWIVLFPNATSITIRHKPAAGHRKTLTLEWERLQNMG